MNIASFAIEPGGILITGAASGIGRETVRLALASGLNAFALDWDESKLQQLTTAFPEVIAEAFDLRCTEKIPAILDSLLGGRGPIRYLVNCAGIWEGDHICKISDELWRKNFLVNLDAPFAIIRSIAPLIRAAGGGAIVNVTSRNAVRSSAGLAPYDASKAALNALTRSAAGDLAPWNIRVNSVMPGVVATPNEKSTKDERFSMAYHKLIPLNRYGRPEEIASVILFLLSQGASFINGEAILIDGGQMACQDNVRFRQIYETFS